MRITFWQPVLCGAVVAAALLYDGSPVKAHHAFGSEFDANSPVLLKGKIAKIEWVNPHTWIHIEIKKDDGAKEMWMVEGGAPTRCSAAAPIRTRFRKAPKSSSMVIRRATITRSARTRAT